MHSARHEKTGASFMIGLVPPGQEQFVRADTLGWLEWGLELLE